MNKKTVLIFLFTFILILSGCSDSIKITATSVDVIYGFSEFEMESDDTELIQELVRRCEALSYDNTTEENLNLFNAFAVSFKNRSAKSFKLIISEDGSFKINDDKTIYKSDDAVELFEFIKQAYIEAEANSGAETSE